MTYKHWDIDWIFHNNSNIIIVYINVGYTCMYMNIAMVCPNLKI